ncbi:uncharacterized protein [Anabrus simplex]|uniref:uncharacterized protein isoform X2 n=1 Tax=Anabrus simplex TaxID=316456 RepID=UPI0035A26438
MECGMTMMTETVWLEEPTDIGCMDPEDVFPDPIGHALVEPKQELIECNPQSQENKNIKVEVDVEDGPESVLHSSDSGKHQE